MNHNMLVDYLPETVEIGSKSCAKIENTSSTYNISWYQRPWEKRGDITVRFKAACNAEDADTARIRLTIDSKNFYTNAGELSDEWTEFEFTSYATPSYFYTYFYNYVANTTVYITDVEILGYMSAYSESQLTILKDSIESEVKRATAQEGTLSSSIKQNAESMIVFANMNSQAVMVGCTGFSDQYMAAVAEENVERIILTKKQAEYFPIGCCVSIGEMGSSTNKDRGQSHMHNLANRVKVTKIEPLDDDSGNYALYVDNGGVTFNTSATTCISTMPWHTGSTDKVKGTCGSPYSNTNGKEPFKFLGIEFALGQYVVRSDVILNGVYDAEADTYQQEIYTCYDCKYFATAINEHYKKLGYVIPDSGNAWKYIKNLGFDVNFPHIRMASEYGGDSNKRFGDAVHTGTRANGTREFLSLGNLWNWSGAGLRIAYLNGWLGNGLWHVSARPSLTGRRGSVVDWASSMGVNLAA